MQLTQAETIEIQKAKTISGRWPKTRWLALMIGILIIALIVFYLYSGSQFAAGIICGIAGVIGVRHIISTAKWWNGIVPYNLILKLLEETEKRPN